MSKRTIQNGIYLVIDPSINRQTLLNKLEEVVKEKIVAVQVWDNFSDDESIKPLINDIIKRCHANDIPVLINNRWQLVVDTELDGVHFDNVPDNFNQIKKELNKEIIVGITCNNDLSVVQWADENNLDYISFCSMFPSSTANSCDLVSFDNIKRVRTITNLPIFLAGGIKPENMEMLNELSYSGIAVVSGIMNAAQPAEALKMYHDKLNTEVR